MDQMELVTPSIDVDQSPIRSLPSITTSVQGTFPKDVISTITSKSSSQTMDVTSGKKNLTSFITIKNDSCNYIRIDNKNIEQVAYPNKILDKCSSMQFNPTSSLHSAIPLHIPTNPMQIISQEIYTQWSILLQHSNTLKNSELPSSPNDL